MITSQNSSHLNQPCLTLSAKDIMNITGKSVRTAYRIIRAVKKRYNIQNRSDISIDEFCEHMRFKEETVLKYLK